MDDRFTDRLSEYLDGELGLDELRELERHLEQCQSCVLALRELRAVRCAARQLTDRAPARDLWPDVRRALTPRWRGRLVPFAAALALLAAGLVAWLLWPREAHPDGRHQFMLILHRETEQVASMTPEQRRLVVSEYRDWARAMARVDQLVDGNKLGTEGGWILRPQDGGASAVRQPAPAEDQLVTGYFVIRARDETDAVAIAKSCPHLRYGGWIELRPIEDV